MKKIFITLLMLPIALHAEENDSTVARQKKFITELFKSGDYFNTIAEARRLQLYHNDPDIEYFIYACYYQAGQYNTVTRQYRTEVNTGADSIPTLMLVSQSFIMLGDYSAAYNSLGTPSYSGLDSRDAFTFLLRRVEPLVLAGSHDLSGQEIYDASEILAGSADFASLKQDLESFRENQGISPVTGAIMSAVIPGLGQLWSGRITDALLSLVSVALPAAGGYYMKKNGHNATAYTLYFFSGLFYAGNIYGGYNSAMLHENQACINNHAELEKKYGRYDPVIYIKFGSAFN